MTIPAIGGHNAPQAIMPQEMQKLHAAQTMLAAAVQAPPQPPAQEVFLQDAMQRLPGVERKIFEGNGVYVAAETDADRLVRDVFGSRPPQGQAAVRIMMGDEAPVAFMPTRGVPGGNGTEKAASIQSLVMEGKATFDDVLSGKLTPDAFRALKEKDMSGKLSGLMWYMQALGSSKSAVSSGENVPGPFRDGLFRIEDPDGRLQAFLEAANHYSGSAPLFLDDNRATMRIDVRHGLPDGMKTIAFTPEPTAAAGGRRMLSLKMEPFGSRGVSAHSGVRARREGEAVNPFRSLKRLFLSIKDTVSRNRAIARQTDAPVIAHHDNRGDVPPRSMKAWNDMVHSLGTGAKSPVATAAVKDAFAMAGDTLLQGHMHGREGIRAQGIHRMLENADAAIGRLEGKVAGGGLRAEDAGLIRTMISDLRTYRDNITANRDHLDIRIGNEIILLRDEKLDGAAPLGQWDGSGPLRISGSVSGKQLDVMKAEMQYRMLNIDEKNLVHIFMADTTRGTYSFKSPSNPDGVRVERNAKEASTELRNLVRGRPLEKGEQDTPLANRTVKMLMSLANQGIISDVMNVILRDCAAAAGVMSPPFGMQGMGIAREPAGDGAQKYTVEWTIDDFAGNARNLDRGGIVRFDGRPPVPVDAGKSEIHCSMKIGLAVHPDGRAEIDVPGQPSFSFVLTPKTAQTGA